MIPAQTEFYDDFIGVRLRPEWEAVNDISIGGVGGQALLISADADTPARLRLGTAVTATPFGYFSDVNNWRPALNPVLDVRVYLNTLDCLATIGFVGAHDGDVPRDDFVALWRPGGWIVQGSNNDTITTIETLFSHTPGTWFTFRFALTATSARFDPPDMPPVWVPQPFVTMAPLLIELQLWGTPTNGDAAMWVDAVSVIQDRD